MDQYLRFINGQQALRRKTSALGIGLGGALGVAADPLPHQLATVRRVLGDSHIRHLLSDEVGLGKTVQALMIINALRWQDPSHRTLVIAPDNLLSQWQEEAWIRGHVMPAIAGTIDGSDDETSPITLARPRDLMTRTGQEARTIRADPTVFDLLIVDEPQTMPRDAIQFLSQVADEFRQVLVLSATPRLGDPSWRDPILRMIEPEAAFRARIEGQPLDEILEDREAQAISAIRNPEELLERTSGFVRAGAGRRVIRNGRADWGEYLPQRRNHEIRIQPLAPERLRFEIADMLLRDADPEQGLQGSAWTSAKALQRSARAARTVLADLTTRGGTLGKMAEEARIASLENPGDSRLDALLDILSAQWGGNPDKAFIIVCGDNPTIDMLRTALPRYFPDLADAISVLRRPASTDVEGVTNLREIQETLAPMLSGDSRLLLVGDWVQAGLNLHHVAQGIIFFSLPWEVDSIDQLIGRVDRLRSTGDRKGAKRTIEIWRILLEGSQEAAIADLVSALGVFDSPLPPLSPSELTEVQASLGQAAIKRQTTRGVSPLAGKGTGLQTRFASADPFTVRRASAEYESWHEQPCPAPAMMNDRARPNDTPIRKEERAIAAWLRAISSSTDFDVGGRVDKEDGYGFQTIWYHGVGERGRAGDSPFLLPGASRDNWMTGHVPFIYRRSAITAPPRKGVFTDDGERSSEGSKSARPLHFLDHGGDLHDALVHGYSTGVMEQFGPTKPVVQTSVRLPEGHPARDIGPIVIATIVSLDPFPDELLPPLWSPAANEIQASAPTEAQRKSLTADRRHLQTLLRAIQRRVRLEVPAQMLRIGSVKGKDGWTGLSTEQVDLCLQPLTSSTNNAVARGKTPLSALEKPEFARAVRSSHLSQLNTEAKSYQSEALQRSRPALEYLAMQIYGHFQAEILNRELALERRRSSPPESGPVELWQGQVAALERSLSMARLMSSEASAYIQEYGSGRIRPKSPEPLSILLALISET